MADRRKALYRFEYNAMTTDSSGNSNTLSSGNAGTNVQGIVGKAFCSTDQDTPAASFYFKSTLDNDYTIAQGDFTLSLWIKLVKEPTAGRYFGFISLCCGNDNTHVQGFAIGYYNPQGLKFSTYNGTTKVDVTIAGVLGTTKWHHLAIAKIGTTCYYYLDGHQVIASWLF
jgi:hypothetical protein